MPWLTKSVVIFFGVTVVFSAGFILGEKLATRNANFTNMRVNHAAEYRNLVEHFNPAVQSLARTLQTPENAYLFVRDKVEFEPWRVVEKPDVVIHERAASCLGKAVLLCSLYRAMGVEPESTYIVMGQVKSLEGTVEHAWVNLIHDGTHYQQDPSNLLGKFDFDSFTDGKYSRSFIRKEKYCFNDRGFAVVSQLNRMDGNYLR